MAAAFALVTWASVDAMADPFDSDWEMDADAMAEEEELLMQEIERQQAERDRQVAAAMVDDSAVSGSLASHSGGGSANVSGTSTVAGKKLPWFPQWVAGSGPANVAGGSASSSCCAAVSSVMPGVVPAGLDSSEVSAPSTPPPSKRQSRLADGFGTPPKQPKGRASVKDAVVVVDDGPNWQCLESGAVSATLPVVGDIHDLPVSPVPAAVQRDLGPPPPILVLSQSQSTRRSVAVEPTATVVESTVAGEPGAIPAAGIESTPPSQASTGRACTRRLRAKTSVASCGEASAHDDDEANAAARVRNGCDLQAAVDVLQRKICFYELSFPAAATWEHLSVRGRKQVLWDLVRLGWSRGTIERLREEGITGRVGNLAREFWSKLGGDIRKAVFEKWCSMVAFPQYINLEEVISSCMPGVVNGKTRAAAMLLTHNNEAWKLPPAASKKRCLDTATFVAQRQSWTKRLFDAACERMRTVTDRYKDMDFALAMEVSPKSLEEGVARVHLHTFLKSPARVWMPSMQELAFQGSLPHVSNERAGNSGGCRKVGWAGFFYCQAPKKGSVHVGGTKLMFTGYQVQVPWILTLLQAEKITIQVARELVTKCVAGSGRGLAEIKIYEEALQQTLVERCVKAARLEIGASRKTWRVLPVVERFKGQFEVMADRYKFLVLEGPSGVGKTVFARSLVTPGMEVLEMNCAGKQPFDLRSFTWGKHGLILFDEVEPSMVAASRKLFQAGNCEVQLGGSATGCYGYSRYLHRVRMVCCSNLWSCGLAELVPDDRAWIEANSLHVVVDSPLWNQ